MPFQIAEAMLVDFGDADHRANMLRVHLQLFRVKPGGFEKLLNNPDHAQSEAQDLSFWSIPSAQCLNTRLDHVIH